MATMANTEEMLPTLDTNLNLNSAETPSYIKPVDTLSKNINDRKQARKWSCLTMIAMFLASIFLIAASVMTAILSSYWFYWPWFFTGPALVCILVSSVIRCLNSSMEKASSCLLGSGLLFALAAVIYCSVEIAFGAQYCTTYDWAETENHITNIKLNCENPAHKDYYFKWMEWAGFETDYEKPLDVANCKKLAKCCVLGDPIVTEDGALPQHQTKCFKGPIQLANHLQAKGRKKPFKCVDVKKTICMPGYGTNWTNGTNETNDSDETIDTSYTS